ncbi:MAG: EthD family reductase [Acidipila sp.]|nr:EthD family reductase [Acidipila sp.]
MLKFVIVLYKRTDISREQFQSYFRDVHGPLAKKLPDVKKYEQNIPVEDPKRKLPDWSAIVELYWEERTAMEAAWASPAGVAATEDLAQFADLTRTTWSVVEEIRLIG